MDLIWSQDNSSWSQTKTTINGSNRPILSGGAVATLGLWWQLFWWRRWGETTQNGGSRIDDAFDGDPVVRGVSGGNHRWNYILVGLYCCNPKMLATNCSGSWLWFVADNKFALVEVGSMSVVTVVRRREAGKMLACYSCTAPMKLFQAFFWWQRGFPSGGYMLLFVTGCERNPVDVKVWPLVVRLGWTNGPKMVSWCYFFLLRCSSKLLLNLFPETGSFPMVDLGWFMFPTVRRI